jgi:hypothetical protein
VQEHAESASIDEDEEFIVLANRWQLTGALVKDAIWLNLLSSLVHF